MKEIVKILCILVLVLSFGSCTQTETEGFDDAVISLKAKEDNSQEIMEEGKVRPNPLLRGSEDDVTGDDDDTITDDDDDEDDDEGPSESDR